MTRSRSAVLALACAAQFLVVPDVSVVNVALPELGAELGMSETTRPWVSTAYALVFGGFLLLGGRLADVLGLRRVVLGGLGAFCLGGAAGGLAASPEVLVGARAAQGLGAAVLAPASLTLLTTAFPEGTARTRAIALWTSIGMAGGTAGNVLGGALVEVLSWRATLLINLPIGLLALPVALRLPMQRESGRARLDVPGALLATGGLVLLTWSITGGVRILPLSSGILLLVALVGHEQRRGDDALLPVRLLRQRSVAAGNAVLLLAGACLNPMWYFLSLTMQRALGYSPLLTGLGFLPHTLAGIAVGVRLVPALMRLIGGRALIAAGALVSAAGFALQSTVGTDSGYLGGILLPGLLIALGGGLLNTPISVVALSGVPVADSGAASGLMNTTKQVGGAVGLAALANLAVPGGTAPQQLTAAYGHAFALMAGLMLATAAAVAALPKERAETAVG